MKSIYLMFTGFSLSGKTWLFNKIEEKFPQRFFPLDSRSIHDYLNQFEVFQDENSVEGRAYEMRQEATDTFQKDIVSVVAKHGYSIAHDSCNRLKKDRKDRLDLVKKLNPDVKTVLLFVNTPKEAILERARAEDKPLGRTVWEDLYKKQLESYENPSKEEADHYIEYDGSEFEHVLSELEKILS